MTFSTVPQRLVSVVVAIYNTERFLAEAIDSVLAQTYPRWELLLVDDGSTDGSTEVAKQYATRYPDRIYYLEHPGHLNQGTCTSRNLGLRHSKGEYVGFLDSDDVWLPKKLEEQTRLMEMHPEVGLLYGHSEYWYDWTGEPGDSCKNHIPPLAPPGTVYHPPSLLKLCFPLGDFTPPCPSAFLLRREALDRISGFEELWDRKRQQLYEDQAFLAKVYLNVPVFIAAQCWDRYRIHENSCCAMAERLGTAEGSRQFYFRWLEQYLRDHQVCDKDVWKAFWRRKRSDRYPRLAALARRVRRIAPAMRNRLGPNTA